ncbi:MAG: hypothetical protein O9293_12500 [Porphyrobacter sp.]|nr:hypothetical protein [Porphyrobacter sp.]
MIGNRRVDIPGRAFRRNDGILVALPLCDRWILVMVLRLPCASEGDDANHQPSAEREQREEHDRVELDIYGCLLAERSVTYG